MWFKDLTNLNTTIIGKQFWRLIEKSTALFPRVFKGQYSRNASPGNQLDHIHRHMAGAVSSLLDLWLAKD